MLCRLVRHVYKWEGVRRKKRRGAREREGGRKERGLTRGQ